MDHGPYNCEGVTKIREALKVPLLCHDEVITEPSISTGIYYKACLLFTSDAADE